jgi:topoisomerase IA-like protein
MAARKKSSGGRKYGKAAGKSVKRAMHKRKSGTLKSGRSGRKVTSRKQAIAIGLSEAREKGAKVPRKRSSSKKSSGGRKSTRKKSPSRKKSSSRKKSTRKKSSR